MSTTTVKGKLTNADVWVNFYSEPYLKGQGKQLGVGDHIDQVPFQIKSCELSPGAQVILDGADVKWLGGLHGRKWVHFGYLDRVINECCNGGRPSRIRISLVDRPAVCLWRDDRYNSYRDVVTFDPSDQHPDNDHMQGRKVERWGMGYIVEDDTSAAFYSYSHGGGGDPAPLVVHGPAEGRFSHRWYGDVSAIKRLGVEYDLVKEVYDWGNRQNVTSEKVVSAGNFVKNYAKATVDSELTATAEEGAEIERHFEASLTAGISVEVSAGVKPIGIGADVAITASIESTLAAGTGETRSTMRGVGHSLTVPVPGRHKQRMLVELTRESCDVPLAKTWRRKSDGKLIEQRGTMRFERLFDAVQTVEPAVPLD